MKTILIVDGICPRGLAIIRHLSSTGEYHILVFTKSTTCSGATAASSLPSVTLLLNRASSGYDMSTFVAAAQRCPSILICSSASNAEGREGVQWGARLMQSAASAGAKHVVFLTTERERKQYSTDNVLHTQPRSHISWTIIRLPTDIVPSPPSPKSQASREHSLTAPQLRTLAYYVAWTFAHADRSTGLDFVLPSAESTATDSKRRDSRVEGSQATRRSERSPASARPGGTMPVGSVGPQGGYMDAGRAKAIQQWVVKTSPEQKEESEKSDVDGEDEEDDGHESSGSESD